MEKYKDIELERQAVRKKFFIFMSIGIAALIIFLLLGMLVLLELFFIGIVIGAIFIAIACSIRGSFQKKFKEKVITMLIKEELGENSHYYASSGISLSSIMEHHMYEKPDRSFEEDLISASYNGVNYSMCDAQFQERHVTYDSRGNRHVRYSTYFKGRIIEIKLNRNLNTRLKIVEGHPMGFSSYGLEKFETELIDFNKKYDTYVNDKEKAFYMLTPVMLQKLLELEKLFKGTIQYSFENNSLMIFINNSGDSLEISFDKKINEENLNIFRSQITLAATIINEFKLDNDKYQKDIEI